MSDPETIEVETTPIEEGSLAVTAVERAAIDSQVATAKQYPRSIDKCVKDALTLATMDEDTAASCFYCLPRGGKDIEGPSARLAEIMAYSWGNLRAATRILGEGDAYITAEGTCFDVEKNVAVRSEVRRRITDSRGRRYKDDMINVTANAASSIALRNAVFKVIPRSLVDRVYQAARRASVGEGGTTKQKRQKAMDWFAKVGVQPEEVFALLEVEGLDDIGISHLIKLRGVITAIKDGEASVESVFRAKASSKEKADDLNAAIEQEAAETVADEDPAEAEEGDPRDALVFVIEQAVDERGAKLSDFQLEAGVSVHSIEAMTDEELGKVVDWLEQGADE